jgi:hypothetical protein
VKQVTSGRFSLRHGRQERVGDIGVGNGRFGKDTGDGPAPPVSAIRKVFAIKEFLAIKEAIALKEALALEEALAIGKRPEFVAVEAGRCHGKVFSSGVARGAL